MHVTEVGYALLFGGAQYVLTRDLLGLSWDVGTTSYLACVVLCVILGQRPTGGVSNERWFYATVLTPAYFALFFFVPLLTAPVACLAALVVGIIFKAACMSVSMHRYSAHQAFTCGPFASCFLHCLGCLAAQGGPLWWATNHRAHHKFCDADKRETGSPNNVDPHSPILESPVDAYAFLVDHRTIKEEFVPRHCDSLAARLIDTWCSLPMLLEYLLAYRLLGSTGLWVACMTGYGSQVLTLWFNVLNHIPKSGEADKYGCRAADVRATVAPNVFFAMINRLQWIMVLIGEDMHEHHHVHGNLAERPGLDLSWRLFVLPMRAVGLISNVKTMNREPPPPPPRR